MSKHFTYNLDVNPFFNKNRAKCMSQCMYSLILYKIFFTYPAKCLFQYTYQHWISFFCRDNIIGFDTHFFLPFFKLFQNQKRSFVHWNYPIALLCFCRRYNIYFFIIALKTVSVHNGGDCFTYTDYFSVVINVLP